MDSYLILVLTIFVTTQGVTGRGWDDGRGGGGEGRGQWGMSGGPILAKCHMKPNEAKIDVLDQFITGNVEIRTSGWGEAAEIKISLSGFSTTDGHDLHGFHIHEWGDLSDGCESAGSHYNPSNLDHGDPDKQDRHVGDLGNIVEEEGSDVIETTITDQLVTLSGYRSVVGRTIVVHENADDLGLGGDEESLKTGNAGTRLACCVIGLADNGEEAPVPPTGDGRRNNDHTWPTGATRKWESGATRKWQTGGTRKWEGWN